MCVEEGDLPIYVYTARIPESTLSTQPGRVVCVLPFFSSVSRPLVLFLLPLPLARCIGS